MRLSKFRMLGVFALTTLVAGAVALPTRAKEPTKTQTFSPLLIAQSSTDLDFSAADDASAAANNAPGAETRSELGTFLDTASSGTTTIIPIPVTDFIYKNGGIGTPTGFINEKVFNSYFKSDFGILGGSNNEILPGPLTASATSSFSPNLTQNQINSLASVTVNFNYAFVSDLGDTLVFAVRNVTTHRTTFTMPLNPTPGESFHIPLSIGQAFPKPGQYEIIYQLKKPGSTDNDVAGFNNVTLTIVKN